MADHYPSYRYHATLPPRIVQNPAEDEALGPGWFDTPAPVTLLAGDEAPVSVPSDPPVIPKRRGRPPKGHPAGDEAPSEPDAV